MNIRPFKGFAMPLALILSASVSSVAFAQATSGSSDSSANEEIVLEQFEVTGSRLSAASVEGALPTISFDSVDIAASGATTLVDYMRELPYSGGGGTIGSNYTNGGNGTSQIALRGIGGENTLVLVNGRRMTPSGTGSAVDLNAIPFSMVERIEILKSGGSVVYGTDAVAGVINVILKSNPDGGEATMYYGNTTDTDVARKQASFSVGGNGDKFRFFLGASFDEQAGLYAPDREYALGGGNSTYGNPGRFYFWGTDYDAINAANGNPGATDWTLKPGVTVATSLTDFQPWNNAAPEDGGSRFPYENFTTMVNPNKRYNFYANGAYDITDNLELSFDVNYANTHSEFQLAPSPYSSFQGINLNNYWYNQLFGAAAETTPGNEPYNVYRFVDFGPRMNVVDRDVFRLVGAMTGEITDTVSFEASWLYSEESTSDKELNGIDQARLEGSYSGTNTTADYNYFTRSFILAPELGGGGIDPDAPYNPQSLIDELKVDTNTAVNSKTQVFDLKLNGTELFELPAGYVEGVVGFEYRKQDVLSKPDAIKLSGSVGWNAADGITEGGRKVMGVYGETAIPITDTLSGTLAYRFEDYADEFEAKVGSAGLRWQAIEDELTLRANFSQGFVAPALLDLYNPGFESFPEIIDTRFDANDPLRLYQVSVSYIGSQRSGEALSPEESDIYSFGATYSPKAIPGLEITVDWALIDQSNLIVYSVQGVVDAWVRSGGPGNPNADFADRIVLQSDATAPDGVTIDQLLGVGPRNVAFQKTEYVDVEAAYRWNTDTVGDFVFGASLTNYLTQEQQTAVTSDTYSYLGTFDGNVVYPEFKGRLSTRWSLGSWGAAVNANYMGSAIDETGGKPKIEADWIINANVSYTLRARDQFETKLTIGGTNLLDNPPPTTPGAFSNNYSERSYSPLGRYLYVKLEQQF
ncbi:TonB-dependent receptor plug domain-containing protein [Synoicihabitans lomoniglobus]|uniref:TonB-dependent receptor n=1 Tax=Synoicihabitans lomoniglobus TaxID=2909285 RepID=A0AAF0CN37_9BACT|nr:TonB-dependent receptor [Opitutaceae bacterium LMO-M01]WED63920.1 TonB-dependent receptor [Opitutaceae bacterium LMO-M01]